ncbi:hypothetical protein JCM33374_g2420 [Metschnikowia sp. JCM 33374]|nr:hypothetical protein JCM33374_g2420 [Metschnikowia sp. JCM 33374]
MSHTVKPTNHANSQTPHNSSHNLFMSKIERSHDDQGIMNLGKNCSFCHRLDFLPFYCEFCKGTYCSAHRTLEVHECVGRPQRKTANLGPSGQESGQVQTKNHGGPTAASLFPDRAKHQKRLDASLEKASATVKPHKNTTPLMKLTKFLHLQRLKREASKKSSFLFGKSGSRPSSPSVEVALIKKAAKGPASVNASDRVYVWVLFVNRNEEELGEISVEKERRPIWVSKGWSVGRALDSIAETMNIINHNNSTQQSQDRLNLFKVDKDVPVALVSSTKVGAAIPNGATLYLIKGAM